MIKKFLSAPALAGRGIVLVERLGDLAGLEHRGEVVILDCIPHVEAERGPVEIEEVIGEGHAVRM
ncbi:hypothetical protein EKN07_06190 [Actinobaculum sp. 352]|nr:hypothetical protein EKN07_06190 [Actinobaculum sp. 352]